MIMFQITRFNEFPVLCNDEARFTFHSSTLRALVHIRRHTWTVEAECMSLYYGYLRSTRFPVPHNWKTWNSYELNNEKHIHKTQMNRKILDLVQNETTFINSFNINCLITLFLHFLNYSQLIPFLNCLLYLYL